MHYIKRVQHEKKTSKMKIVQYEENALWKRYNVELKQHKKLQYEKINAQKSARWKRCSMKKVQHEKSATRKKFNMKRVYNEAMRKK